MSTEPSEPEAGARPTGIRYLIVGLAMLASVLLYLDRYCISFAERYLKQDLGLSNNQISWVLSAFFISYALAQVPSGYLADRFGARKMLTLYILTWSLFTGLTGLATGFIVLIVFRLGMGLGQAGGYPTCAGLISKWVPYPSRGQASSLIAFGGRIGGFLAPMLTALLIVWFVPVSSSSLFSADDILDLREFCVKLTEKQKGSQDESLGAYLLAGLPGGERQAVENFDRQQSAARSSGALKEALSTRLNAALDDRQLFREAWFEETSLPAEAKSLLAMPADKLDIEQVQRLNRLLLEQAYPDSLRKVYVAGWRPVMFFFGSLGLVVAVVFWFLYRDRPDLHPRCNEAEVKLITESLPAGVPSPHGRARRVPIGNLMRSGVMWLVCITHMGTNVGWVFLVTWLPRYLAEVHKVPIQERGVLAGIPLFIGWGGMLLGGKFTDWLTRRVGRRWGRALPISASRFVAMAAYIACLLHPDPYLATAAFALVALGTDFGSPAMWAFSLDVGGRYAGSVFSWANMWGNMGAAFSPVLLNWVVGSGVNPRWDLAFVTCAAAFGVAGVAALGINATISIAPADEVE